MTIFIKNGDTLVFQSEVMLSKSIADKLNKEITDMLPNSSVVILQPELTLVAVVSKPL